MQLPSYKAFVNKYEGQIAFICGAGLSFYECIFNPKFDLIFNHVVVSVNSSFIAMPWSRGDADKRFWISNDALVRRWSYWADVKKAKANRIVRDSWSKHFHEIPDFFQFSPRPTPEDIINPLDEGLCYCSSIPSALDLCLQMGCKNIFLLGVDQYFDEQGLSHFWQKLPRQEQPTRNDGKLASHAEQKYAFMYNNLAFQALSDFAQKCSAKVYNCSLLSKVNRFPKLGFEEAIKITNQYCA